MCYQPMSDNNRMIADVRLNACGGLVKYLRMFDKIPAEVPGLMKFFRRFDEMVAEVWLKILAEV